jgi:hypothetical protein
MLTLTGTIDPMQSYTKLRLPDGKTVLLPTSMLLQTAAAPEGSAPSSVASPSEALDIQSHGFDGCGPAPEDRRKL